MADPAPTYPKRPGHFAHKFCRLLAKATVANELGADVCWLLTVIAHTEDARGYRGAVTFHNGQLMSFCGFGSIKKLERARKVAVDAGWLHYAAGSRTAAPRYWVLVRREHVGTDDLPSDERPDKYETTEPANKESSTPTGVVLGDEFAGGRADRPPQPSPLTPTGVGVRGEFAGSSRGRSGGRSVAPSSLHLHLDQDPLPPDDPSPVASGPEAFDPLRADQDARKVFEGRWRAAGLRKFSFLSATNKSRLAALLRSEWWAANYPAALARAGSIPWLRDGTGRQRGAYDVGEFLRDEEEARKLIDGVYDQTPPVAPAPRSGPQVHRPPPDPREERRKLFRTQVALGNMSREEAETDFGGPLDDDDRTDAA